MFWLRNDIFLKICTGNKLGGVGRNSDPRHRNFALNGTQGGRTHFHSDNLLPLHCIFPLHLMAIVCVIVANSLLN